MGSGLLTGFLALMVTGLPVAMAMAVASLVYVIYSGTIPDFVVIHRMYGGVDSFPLLAVPFFIWAGNLMNSAGITNRIYNFALALVGWMKGGLGHVNVVGSMIFAGMSGTAIADAAGLGTIEIKAMTDHGYSKEFAVGVVLETVQAEEELERARENDLETIVEWNRAQYALDHAIGGPAHPVTH